MAAVRVDVAPDLLRWAVQRARWDAETIDRRVPQFRDWVVGATSPTLKQIEAFAAATHTPFGLLFLPEPPVEEVPIPDMRMLGDSAVPQPSVDLLDTIYLCQRRQDWYRDFAQDCGIGRPEFVGSMDVEDSPKTVAAEIRDLLDFELEDRRSMSSWTDALRRLIARIEEIGVLVMVNGIVGANTHRRLDPEEFRGFALSDPIVPLIFVNGADTRAAQIFTLVHELAHIWLGHSALTDSSLARVSHLAEERWCNQVAAEVLVPQDAVKAEYRGNPDPDELDRMAADFSVSTLVVLRCIFDAGLLSWEDFRIRYVAERERVIGILATRQGEGGGNFYRTQPLRLSRRFARAVIASAREGSTTYRDAFHLLGTKKRATFDNLATELGVA